MTRQTVAELTSQSRVEHGAILNGALYPFEEDNTMRPDYLREDLD